MQSVFFLIFITVIFNVVFAFNNISRTISVKAGQVLCFYRKLAREEFMYLKYKVIAAETDDDFIISFKLSIPRDGAPPPSQSFKWRSNTVIRTDSFRSGAKVIRRREIIYEDPFGTSSPEITIGSEFEEDEWLKTLLSGSFESTASDQRLDGAAKEGRPNALAWNMTTKNYWRDIILSLLMRNPNPAQSESDAPNLNSGEVPSDYVVVARDQQRDTGEHTVRATVAGDYRFCFDNSFDKNSYKAIQLYLSTYLPARAVRSNDKIVLALTVCGSRINESLNAVKSALIFSRKALHVVIFTEKTLQPSLDRVLLLWRDISILRLSYEFHHVQYPRAHGDYWRSMQPLCSAQRLFVPDLLPAIDALIYIDTDVVFLGAPEELWRFFENFGANSVMALAPEHGVSSRHWAWYPRFATHPYYGDYGVNTGVMLMNLTRLRNFQWAAQVLSTMTMWKPHLRRGDQDIINIIFSYHAPLLLLLPCEYNYREGGACAAHRAVRVLHGNRGHFHGDHDCFLAAVYKAIDGYEVGSDPRKTLLPQLRAARRRGSPQTRSVASTAAPGCCKNCPVKRSCMRRSIRCSASTINLRILLILTSIIANTLVLPVDNLSIVFY